MDIGQPKDFVTGVGLYLTFLAQNDNSKLAKGDNFVGNVLVVCKCISVRPDLYMKQGCI